MVWCTSSTRLRTGCPHRAWRFVAHTAAYNWEPSLALLLVTATKVDLAVDDTSGGVGPMRVKSAIVNVVRLQRC
jgi:hypothetical protein